MEKSKETDKDKTVLSVTNNEGDNLSPDRKKDELTLKPTTIVFEHSSVDLEPNPDDPNFPPKRSKTIQKFPAVTVSYMGKEFITALEKGTELAKLVQRTLNLRTEPELKELDAKIQKLNEEIKGKGEVGNAKLSFPLIHTIYGDREKHPEVIKYYKDRKKNEPQNDDNKLIQFEDSEPVLVRIMDRIKGIHLVMIIGLADHFGKEKKNLINDQIDNRLNTGEARSICPNEMPTLYFTVRELADCMGYPAGKVETKHRKVILNILSIFSRTLFDIIYEVPKRNKNGKLSTSKKFEKDIVIDRDFLFKVRPQLDAKYKDKGLSDADQIKHAKGFYITPNKVLFAELNHLYVEMPHPKILRQQFLKVTGGTRVSDLQLKLYPLMFGERTEIYKNNRRDRMTAIKQGRTPHPKPFQIVTDVADLADRLGISDYSKYKARRENEILNALQVFELMDAPIVLSSDLQNNGELTIKFKPMTEPIRTEKAVVLSPRKSQKKAKKSEPNGEKSEPSGEKSEPSGKIHP